MHRPKPRPFGTGALWSIILILLFAAEAAYGQAVRIMPMGDSTTSGYRQYVSYRYDLWFDLLDAGFDVDFVGGQITTDGNPNLDFYPEYLTAFDRDHEGFSGYRTDQLAEIARSVSARQQPDIVLLWAGINDIWEQGAAGVTNARFGLRDIIEDLRASVPGVTILLALTPPYDHDNSEFVTPLNTAIADIVVELDSPGSPIILVDLHSGYNIGSMTWDNVHQNRNGEAWVADRWFEVLANIIPDSGPGPFQINAGHSGAWFNPATSGQGQLIEVEPEEQFIFLAWFTFTDAASASPFEHHWYTAQGNYTGSSAELILHETLGGQFDDPQPPTTNPVGTVTVSFSDCRQGQMVYNIDTDGRQGTIPLHRVIPGSENVCEEHIARAAATTEAVDINVGMDGTWANSDTLGQGFLIDAHPDPQGGNFIFVAWFTYGDDTASGQRWLTAQGDFAGSTAAIDVYETTGGLFDDPQTVNVSQVGTMNIDFTDCSNAQLSYNLTDDDLNGEMTISRLTPGAEALCEELALVD